MASSSTSSYLLFVFLFYNYLESVFLNFSQKFSVIFLVIFSISFSLPTLTFAADCNGSTTTTIRESDGEREGESGQLEESAREQTWSCANVNVKLIYHCALCLSFALTHTHTQAHLPQVAGASRERATRTDKQRERGRDRERHDQYLMRILSLFLFLLLLVFLLFVYVVLNPFLWASTGCKNPFWPCNSLSLSLPLTHTGTAHTVARTGSNWPSFLSLKYLCKFSFVHNLFNLSSHSLTHTCTLSVSGNRKKKPTKILKDHCASIAHTQTHTGTLAFTDTVTVTHTTFITSFVLGLTFATRRRRRNDDVNDTNARERSWQHAAITTVQNARTKQTEGAGEDNKTNAAQPVRLAEAEQS